MFVPIIPVINFSLFTLYIYVCVFFCFIFIYVFTIYMLIYLYARYNTIFDGCPYHINPYHFSIYA
jgi:hypothetical protein